ncbi:unnamed protein product [Mesocestoides corti]|uniref:Uncharacterized protein n=2 Tax=Mesocestoides corti TaxID=53468 RepID=A0A0R3U2K8_MESCO|nr:unnamed protein product [Mesocestoides corti]
MNERVKRKFFAWKNPDKSRDAAIQQIVQEEMSTLGPIEWAEGSALGILVAVVLLWVSRKPGVEGWSALVPLKQGSRIDETGSSLTCVAD